MADSSNDILAEHVLADVWGAAQRRRSQFLAVFLRSIFRSTAHERNHQGRAAAPNQTALGDLRDAA
jgi:hypothetical protein